MIHFKKTWIIFFFFLISCSSIPKDTSDGCSIFSERYLWYKHSKKTEQKWGTPIYIQLAIIKMESDFDWLARPERNKIFKIIPYKRPSSSFGYSQAVKGTWKQYKKETNNPLAILGGLVGLLLVGSSINVYSQIALIILIGLATKNGILIVEFANQMLGQNIKMENI